MKNFTLIIFIILLFGCGKSDKKQVDLPVSQILATELVDFKPYLVFKNRVDTLYEIITEGEVGLTKKGDTLNSYINISDTIYSELNSVMCCKYEYFFKDDLLVYEKINSDYTLINNIQYNSSNQMIYKISQSRSYFDTTIYKILNNKISWKLNLNNTLEDTTFYFYKDGFLTRKITTDISPLHKGNTKYVSEFKRNSEDNSLKKTIYTSVNTIQIINFDKDGIPKETIFISYDSLKSDTICKTKWTSPTFIR